MVKSLAAALAIVASASAGIIGQSMPRTSVLVERVASYVDDYQRAFVELVADEHTIQEVRHGDRVVERRDTRGELFATFVEQDDAWMTVHEVTEVDGVAVPTGIGARSLLTREPFGVAARRLAASNTRYNIGRIARNFNEPTIGLIAFTRKHADQIDVDRGVTSTDAGTPLVALTYRAQNGYSPVRSATGTRVSMRGSATAEVTTGRIRQTSVTFRDGNGITATIDTTFSADERLGAWVPTLVVERYQAPRIDETITAVSTLSNYRKFGVRVRIQ
jgi:hypothetical protein